MVKIETQGFIKRVLPLISSHHVTLSPVYAHLIQSLYQFALSFKVLFSVA